MLTRGKAGEWPALSSRDPTTGHEEDLLSRREQKRKQPEMAIGSLRVFSFFRRHRNENRIDETQKTFTEMMPRAMNASFPLSND